MSLISRPEGHLHDFPLNLRWEVCRRHPYYLVFWRNALSYRRGEIGDAPAVHLIRYAAHLILNSIGVSGLPIEPTVSAYQIGNDLLDPAFLSGAVQPLTLRAVATMLMNNLPPAELAVLGAHFLKLGTALNDLPELGNERSIERELAMGELTKLVSPTFDSYPVAPLFYIQLRAAQRVIRNDIERIVRRMKKDRGIGERRIHVNKLSRYLEVWDLREGWATGSYDRKSETIVSDIAKQRKVPISTIASQYREAFWMITGHEFSPELWTQLMAPLKLSETFKSAEEILSSPIRRQFSSATQRPVPESVITPHQIERGGLLDSAAPRTDDQSVTDFFIDLRELLAQDMSDGEIAKTLGCDANTIAYLRERHKEFSSEL